MDTAVDVTLIGTLAAVWLAAGLLADGLSTAGTALHMRRRARLLTGLIAAGAAIFVAVPMVTALTPGVSSAPTAALLPAVPALIVLTAGLRRLSWVRRGAGAFATAPLAPVPPALRAAAAHPLIAAPLQVAGLAAVVGLPLAAGLVQLPGDGVPATTGFTGFAGIAITLVALAVVAIGVRAILRHSRLAPLVLAPIDRARERVRATAR
ncbi:hypothetical protein BJY16_001627 [Actinoplanes octamycinicus]|uniref:Uncharacterized protein n=1 Tax=Actinoplanes octamycinicus TaxID=135948 RepID=A0A7W7M5W7_9ACTN|nr:hypothetical protein [Actinoplanes octamycinicus]MBB4738168.1 hypothetical protein [Actinoplanes octamycinicus]GIE59273.1 hypothetical protein Aoc01nite_46750 [Actinoplanes octamycinicus]